MFYYHMLERTRQINSCLASGIWDELGFKRGDFKYEA